MTEPERPKAWANLLAKAWGNRFPVDVQQVALEYSRVKFSEEPIVEIVQADVGKSFEGCLYYASNRKGWFILYNPAIAPSRRINFTVAHELGHYLVHRELRKRFECSQGNVIGIDGSNRDIEREANEFASFLMMPANDFREQIGANSISLDLLQHCAERYDVTLTAAALKWLDITGERATLVVSRDDFILWSRSSNAAYRSGIFFRSGTPVPEQSLAYQTQTSRQAPPGDFNIPAGVWSATEPVREQLIVSDRYDLNISLLVFARGTASAYHGDEESIDLAHLLQSDMTGRAR